MSKKISYMFKAQVAAGPAVGGTGTFEVDAIDELHIELAAGTGNAVSADVQPGTAAQMIVITSSVYSDQITYTVDKGSIQPQLDGPHVLIGRGAVSLLGATQNKFEFTNAGTDPATITILVGRKATSLVQHNTT